MAFQMIKRGEIAWLDGLTVWVFRRGKRPEKTIWGGYGNRM